ncbi:MAG: His/Gly/Thr/Pro-type tRNA ligase C-terminal domain-containing protein, partial [Flavobacteriaceae bacterium]|nr:His/Gly/Thr/Pro-type tRNA ligase C-terminal domain-containing protein [Flavobacteriaceae bacterium]
THSDDNGLVLPPNLAPEQVVIVPIYRNEEQKSAIAVVANQIKTLLNKNNISVNFDNRDTYKPGWKFNEYELKGVPVRLAIGPNDLENKTVELSRRDTLTKETILLDNVLEVIQSTLDLIQKNLYERALNYRNTHITNVDNYTDFKNLLETKGGFLSAHWDGTAETEEKIKEETKATIRCIPIENTLESGICIYSGKPSTQRVLFAKAY